MIEYRTSLSEITPDNLQGFFVGWKQPLSATQHFNILQNSYRFVLAWDTNTSRVVGFINALSDGIHFAFIPLLEVLPTYQGRGIGSCLVNKMLDLLRSITCIDLTCDTGLQDYYRRFGMLKSNGMVIRKYLNNYVETSPGT